MSFNNKLVLPIALGFSIVSITVFMVYYIFKDEDEDEKDKKTKIKSAKLSTVEIKVSKSIVPALIGRCGTNIKDIEIKSGARINFKKFSDKDYDVCFIKGNSQSTQLAESLVHEFIRNQPVIEEDKMTVPAWAIGRIIGSGGDNINDISHRSGARVKVISSTEDKTATREINFRGSKDQIKSAMDLIESCVAQEKCRREIEQSKRSPRHTQTPSRSETPTEMPGDKLPQTQKHARKSEVSGPSIEVYVSAVSSPARFWAQIVGPQVSQLDNLVETMTDYYNNKDNREMHALSNVSVGQVVAAVFRHDGRWYRARVTDIRPNEFDSTQMVADVFYLDYGDSEYVATHELCELRSDLLRLRFQAMECFLAGVRPRNNEEKWQPEAVARFEELTQVARWKSLVSKTCTYKKSVVGEDEKHREVPGIMLFDVTEDGEIDIGGVLVEEGWADLAPPVSVSSPVSPPPTPFGDLGNSRVLSMLAGERGDRSASVPRDTPAHTDNPTMTTSASLATGLAATNSHTNINSIDLTYPNKKTRVVNGSHENFLTSERQHDNEKASNETLVPTPTPSPHLGKTERDEFKANINRIDSHHGNLEALGKNLEHNNII